MIRLNRRDYHIRKLPSGLLYNLYVVRLTLALLILNSLPYSLSQFNLPFHDNTFGAQHAARIGL